MASRKRKRQTKKKRRHAKAEKPTECDLCRETDSKIRRFTVLVDKRKVIDWHPCRSCTAVLEVLLRDPRNRRH